MGADKIGFFSDFIYSFIIHLKSLFSIPEADLGFSQKRLIFKITFENFVDLFRANKFISKKRKIVPIWTNFLYLFVSYKQLYVELITTLENMNVFQKRAEKLCYRFGLLQHEILAFLKSNWPSHILKLFQKKKFFLGCLVEEFMTKLYTAFEPEQIQSDDSVTIVTKQGNA